MVDNMDLDLGSLSYDELLDIYGEEVNFINFLEDLLPKDNDEEEEEG